MQTKQCGKCREIKDVSLFSKSNKKPSGYQSYCKTCAHPHRAQWARDNTTLVRGYRLKYTYGLTPEQFAVMLDAQNNACKICKVEFDKTPSIDHDHSCCGANKACSQCVRGLLCQRCNIFIGYFEKYEYMEQVKTYLAEHDKDLTPRTGTDTMEAEASELNNYLGKRFIYEAELSGQRVYAEGIIVSVESYESDLGYGDHVVTYLDNNGELNDFFVFGHAKFKLMN